MYQVVFVSVLVSIPSVEYHSPVASGPSASGTLTYNVLKSDGVHEDSLPVGGHRGCACGSLDAQRDNSQLLGDGHMAAHHQALIRLPWCLNTSSWHCNSWDRYICTLTPKKK